MQKYKLINLQTKEEHLCDKVTIDGFDYYVSNEKLKDGDWFYNTFNNNQPKIQQRKGNWKTCFNQHKIIATNNPNIDIPQVVDEVEKICEEEWLKHPNNDVLYGDSVEMKNAYKAGVWDGYKKSQERYSFSEEDMLDFYEWCDTSEEAAIFWRRNRVDPDMSGNHWKKIRENREKLLKLWKEQHPKIVYYNG